MFFGRWSGAPEGRPRLARGVRPWIPTPQRGAKPRRGGRARHPISKTITGAILELDPGALRELHWHPTADVWQYVYEGRVSVTLFGANGRYRTETLEAGDIGYIPQGYGHSLENVGDRSCRVLIGFNSGVYEEIDLTEWIAANPADVLATDFGRPAALFNRFPRRDAFITDRNGR